MGSDALADHDLVAPSIDDEPVQGPGRRTGDVLTVEVEVPVVACAPDVAQVGSILHRAVQVRADGRERPEFTGRRAQQDAGSTAELEHLPSVGLHVVGLERERDRGGCGLSCLRRDEVAADWIQHRQQEGSGAGAEHPVDEPSSGCVILERPIHVVLRAQPSMRDRCRRSICRILRTSAAMRLRMITRDTPSPVRRNLSSSRARTPRALAFALASRPASISFFTASTVNVWTAVRALTTAFLASLRSNCAWLTSIPACSARSKIPRALSDSFLSESMSARISAALVPPLSDAE